MVIYFFFASTNFFSNLLTQILFVNKFISSKSTFAPQCIPQVAEAINVLAEVHNHSFFNPNAKHAICSAEVAELTTITFLIFTIFLTYWKILYF